MATIESTATRFWSKVNKSESCWFWTGKLDKDGYGRFWNDNRTTRAHRFSWELANGPILSDLLVLHKCDVPCCVNPDHLFLGTQEDNIKDKVSKGRQAFGNNNGVHTHPEKVTRGEASHLSKLTENIVREIRVALATGKSLNQIAREFGVVKGTILFIKKGKTWRHVV